MVAAAFRWIGLFIILITLSWNRAEADPILPGPDPDMAFYAPAADEETPLLHTQGEIVRYQIGSEYGEVDIHDTNHALVKMLIGGDLQVEGHTLTCMHAPEPGEEINVVLCPDWPATIVLRKTPVAVTYWIDYLNNRPILVVSKITHMAVSNVKAKAKPKRRR